MNDIVLRSKQSAVEVRRSMPVNVELNSVERAIYEASIMPTIGETAELTLVAELRTAFKGIAGDVGYKPSDGKEWRYTQTRLYELLRKYYSHISVNDVKLSFELAATGQLNEWLDDVRHYNSFSPMYFGRVLNAYMNKRNEVLAKIYEAAPQEEKHEEQDKGYWRRKFSRIFLKYKYTGALEFSPIDIRFLHDFLVDSGRISDCGETKRDRKLAYIEYIRLARQGLKNQYEAFRVRNNGEDSPELDYIAENKKMLREIKEYFDECIRNN